MKSKKKNGTDGLIYKTNRVTGLENKPTVIGEEGREG